MALRRCLLLALVAACVSEELPETCASGACGNTDGQNHLETVIDRLHADDVTVQLLQTRASSSASETLGDAQGAPESCNGKNVPFTVSHGIKFTWASPCSGGCSTPQPKCGWNYCSDAQWSRRNEAQMKNEFPCGAPVFDPKWNHCDKSNRLVQRPDNGYNELVFCKEGGGDSPAPAPANDPESCEGKNVPFTPNNGVKYTWASPCSGGCSTPQPKCGWNYCSDAQWATLPEAEMKNSFPCGAPVFDPKWNHCDKSNRLVQRPDNGYNELVFCKEGGSPAPAPAPDATTTTTTAASTPSPTPSPLDDLDDEERDEEVEDEQNDIVECAQWCWKSKKHVNKPWHGPGGKCGWNACQTCPECVD